MKHLEYLNFLVNQTVTNGDGKNNDLKKISTGWVAQNPVLFKGGTHDSEEEERVGFIQ